MTSSADSVTVVQFSDTHLCREASSAPDGPDRGLERAVALAAPLRPDLLLLTGDITNDESVEACRRVRSILSTLDAPIVATPGNHDDRDAVQSVFTEPHDRQIGGWRIILADTLVPGRISGRIDVPELLDRLGPEGDRPTLLAMHHPPIGTSTKEWFVLQGSAGLVSALSSRRDVVVVAAGHLHEAFHVVLSATSYIGCSSTWYSLAHHGDDFTASLGHIGAVAYRLHPDGTWQWWRMPRPEGTQAQPPM